MSAKHRASSQMTEWTISLFMHALLELGFIEFKLDIL